MNAFQAIVQFIADEASLKALQNKVKSTTMTQKVTMDTSQAQKAVSDLARQTKVNSMQAWASNNSKAMKRFGTDVNGIIKEMGSSTTMTKARFDELNLQFKQIQNNARLGGQLGKSMFDKLGTGMQKFAFWTSSTFLIMKGIHSIKEAVNFAKEFDSALANINYTMGVTKSELNDIGDASLKTAKELKTSAENVLAAVTTYANANETANSILSKARPTIMLSNVSGMDTATTTDILQGTLNQFDLEDSEETLMHISDVLQKVSQSMPVDFAKGINEMAEGIKVSGSVARDAGYDLEAYSALLGNLISTTRQSGSELGRSLRTMFVRTTRASTSALAGGEVTEDDISRAETALKRVGIQVRDSKDSFRDFDDIMTDLYHKIDTLSEVDLSNIAYEVASTRQNVCLSI